MRTPKYRAWYAYGKQNEFGYMVEVESIKFNPDGSVYVNEELPDCTLMEWTGLKDKNGVEIYEGDIIKDKNSHAEWVRPVVWIQSEARFGADDGGGDFWAISEEAEVLGNIYEHSHLIKEAYEQSA